MKFKVNDEVLVHERLRATVAAFSESEGVYYVRYCDGKGADYHDAASLTLAPPKPV